MEDNGRIVKDFCAAFARLDADELIAYFSVDAVYHNVPMQPLVGRAAIYEYLKAVPARIQDLRFETLRQVASDNIVMNERIDHFVTGGRSVSLPIAGVFELQGGKITAWREYFDLATLMGA